MLPENIFDDFNDKYNLLCMMDYVQDEDEIFEQSVRETIVENRCSKVVVLDDDFISSIDSIVNEDIVYSSLHETDAAKREILRSKLMSQAGKLKCKREFERLYSSLNKSVDAAIREFKKVFRQNESSVAAHDENYEKFHRWSRQDKDGNSVPIDTLDDLIVDEIIDKNHIFILFGKPYLYRNGVYDIDNDGCVIKSIIGGYIYLELRKAPRIKQIYDLLMTRPKLRVDESQINNHPKWFVNFKNGMLDLKSMKLLPHSPEYLSINQIPHEWIDSPPPPESVTVKFFKGTIPNEDDRKMHFAYSGYCLTPDTSQQLFEIIAGDGNLGKSVMLWLDTLVFGNAKNYSSITLQNLNDRFSPAFLVGKLVNIYADLPSTDMGDTAGIKTVTGEDSVRAEYKGGNVFAFHPYCKLKFSANKIPKSRDDKTTAYYRRMIILKIDRRGDEIPNLKDELRKDLQSYIYLIVHAAHEMYVNGGVIKKSERCLQEVNELYLETDTVKAFLEDCNFIYTGKDIDRIERKKLYRMYEDYCEDEDRLSGKFQPTGFYSNLRDKGFGMYRNSQARYITGIKQNVTATSDNYESCDDSPFD